MPIKVRRSLSRYHNHLKASISNAEWGEEEDRDLLRLHGEYGNKWSIIAQKIEGRYAVINLGLKIA